MIRRSGGQLDSATPPPAILPRRGRRGAAETRGEVPIYNGERFYLGMRLASSIWGKEGSFYVLTPHGAFAHLPKRKFPLSQKGWDRMWQEFAAADPSGALACKQELQAREGPQEPSSAAANRDALDQLERLAALHERGELSDDEFQAAKQELLRRL